MLVGVDIGGTFTDLVLSQADGLTIHKIPSTPDNPASAMLAGLEMLTDGQLDALMRVAHGSTVATNAILERKGARTAFITTQGFRDLLFIGRQDRPDLYALQPGLPEPLIPRERCFEVPERLDHRGDVMIPLDVAALDAVLDQLAALDVESLAVCLLYSYVDPTHEQHIRQRIVERGILAEWQVALSSDVLPEFREYERASTVTLEAYVRPMMARYTSQLYDSLPGSVGLRIMKSDGGVISAQRVARQSIHTALSGPAAGVIGAYAVARAAGYQNIITLDMGGTSTDVSICPGQPIQRPQSEIDGLPLRVRLLDIETIGAGGGSIARVDAGGVLRVGPESAGAQPGPAVYGRGGPLPTVSDANAILGRLDSGNFLGGGMTLDLRAGKRALKPLAKSLNLSLVDTAQGIVDVANANIDRAVRRVSVARGYDPRDFALVAFGGAGALHACAVAERLGIERIIIPRHPGVLCAYGLLVSNVVIDYTQSVLATVMDTTIDDLAPMIESMLATAKADLIAEGIEARDDRIYEVSVDLRYAGQAYELNVPMDATRDIRAVFHEVHHQTYGHHLAGRMVEVVNLRVQAIGLVAHPPMPTRQLVTGMAEPLGTPKTSDGVTLARYQRDRIQPGQTLQTPALVFQLDSTVFIPSGWQAQADTYDNLELTYGG